MIASTSVRQRSGAWVVAALAPGAVLACDPGGFFPFGPAKWLLITALLPAGVGLLAWHRPLRFAPRPTRALGVLVLVMAAAAVVGEDPLYGWIGTPERHLGVLAWVLVALAFVAGQSLDIGDRRLVGRATVVAALGLGVASTVEAFGAMPSVIDAGSRLGGTLGSPAYLGAAVALLGPVALGVSLDRGWTRWWRGAAATATGTLVIAGLGSGARAAWVGLVVAAATTAVARRQRLAAHRRTLGRGAIGLLLAFGVIAVASPVGDRIANVFDADAPGGQGRLDEWRVAVRVLEEHPLTGVGPEGYRVAFADGVDAAYEREHGREPLPDRAHSGPLDIALTGGPGALAAWLALLVVLARPVRRALTGDQPWLVGVASGLVAYLAGQLLLFPLAELEPVAALLAGVVVAATAAPGELRERVLPRGIPTAFVVLTAVALVAGVLDVLADRKADDATEALSTFDLAEAVDRAEEAVGLRPDVLRLHLLLSVALERDERGVVAALGAIEDALDLSPGDPIAQRRRAELLVERADATRVPAHITAARDELDDLLRDDPDNGLYWLLAGAAARLDGDTAAARAAIVHAIDLAPTNPIPYLSLVQLEVEHIGRLLAEHGTG